MDPERAMEQYIMLLSESIPGLEEKISKVSIYHLNPLHVLRNSCFYLTRFQGFMFSENVFCDLSGWSVTGISDLSTTADLGQCYLP